MGEDSISASHESKLRSVNFERRGECESTTEQNTEPPEDPPETKIASNIITDSNSGKQSDPADDEFNTPSAWTINTADETIKNIGEDDNCSTSRSCWGGSSRGSSADEALLLTKAFSQTDWRERSSVDTSTDETSSLGDRRHSANTTVGEWIATYASRRAVTRPVSVETASSRQLPLTLRYKGVEKDSSRSLPTGGVGAIPKYSKIIRINKSEPQVHIRCPIQNLYVFKEKIGVGSWGVVHLAVERSSGFLRAIKKIPKRPNMDMKRFRQEMTILRGFDHPRVIRLYETFEDYSTLYMVMEYCRGGELFQRISEEGALPEAAVAWIMREILSAIAYCHSKGVCHRDIKPENFLFSDKDIRSSLKLVDFGLAQKFSHGGDPLSSKVGTLFYLAPELVNNEHYDHKVDLWSAGVMMYSMLFGQPPFSKNGCSDAEILKAISAGHMDYHPYQSNSKATPSISPAAENLIRALCCKDPNQRLEASQALAHAWFVHQFPSPLRHLPTLNSFARNQCAKSTSSVATLTQKTVSDKPSNVESPSGEQSSSRLENWSPSAPSMKEMSMPISLDSNGKGRSDLDDTNLPSKSLFCCDFIELGCERHSKRCQKYSKGEVRPYRSITSPKDKQLPNSESPSGPNEAHGSPFNVKTPQAAAINLLNKLGLRSSGDAAILAQKLILKLENFARLNPLKKALLALAAQQLEPHVRELAYIRCIFDLLDTGRDGVLTFEELFNSISALQKGQVDSKTGKETTPTAAASAEESLKSLLFYVDLDGDGVIEYSDFVAACLDQSTFRHPAAYKAVFRVLDRDMDNKIGLNELKAALGWNKLDSNTKEDTPDDENTTNCITTTDASADGETDQQFILKLLTEADVDQDGFIGQEDFTAIFANEEDDDNSAAARLYQAENSRSVPLINNNERTHSQGLMCQSDSLMSASSPQLSPCLVPESYWRDSTTSSTGLADQFDFSAETRNIFHLNSAEDVRSTAEEVSKNPVNKTGLVSG